jgi:hypothetical protein
VPSEWSGRECAQESPRPGERPGVATRGTGSVTGDASSQLVAAKKPGTERAPSREARPLAGSRQPACSSTPALEDARPATERAHGVLFCGLSLAKPSSQARADGGHCRPLPLARSACRASYRVSRDEGTREHEVGGGGAAAGGFRRTPSASARPRATEDAPVRGSPTTTRLAGLRAGEGPRGEGPSRSRRFPARAKATAATPEAALGARITRTPFGFSEPFCTVKARSRCHRSAPSAARMRATAAVEVPMHEVCRHAHDAVR